MNSGGYYEPEPNPQGQNQFKRMKAEYKFIINMLKRGYTEQRAKELLSMENMQYPKSKLNLRQPHTYMEDYEKVKLTRILRKNELTAEQKAVIKTYEDKLTNTKGKDTASITWREFLKQHRAEFKNYGTLGEFAKAMSAKYYQLKMDKIPSTKNKDEQTYSDKLYEIVKDVRKDYPKSYALQFLAKMKANEYKSKKPHLSEAEFRARIIDDHVPFVGYLAYSPERKIYTEAVMSKVYNEYINDKTNKYGINPEDHPKLVKFVNSVSKPYAKAISDKYDKIDDNDMTVEERVFATFYEVFARLYLFGEPMQPEQTLEQKALGMTGSERAVAVKRHRALRKLINDGQASEKDKKEFDELEEIMKIILKGVEQGRGFNRIKRRIRRKY